MTATDPEAASPREEEFQHLPSARLLMDLILGLRREMNELWAGCDNEDEQPCRIQGLAWPEVEYHAQATLEVRPSDPVACELLRTWKELNDEYGAPERRNFGMRYAEAWRRYRAMTRYLIGSGPQSLRQAEVDAPRQYLSDDEAEGA